jgi:hypothetical protein
MEIVPADLMQPTVYARFVELFKTFADSFPPLVCCPWSQWQSKRSFFYINKTSLDHHCLQFSGNIPISTNGSRKVGSKVGQSYYLAVRMWWIAFRLHVDVNLNLFDPSSTSHFAGKVSRTRRERQIMFIPETHLKAFAYSLVQSTGWANMFLT